MDRFFSLLQKQRVIVKGVKYDWTPVLSGVPQGHRSWSLVVLSVYYDISSDIESKIRLFLMTVFAILKLRMKKTQWNFKRILIDWVPGQGSGVWDFNLSKSNMMQLTRKRFWKIRSSYSLEGTDLENVESIKCLGVTISSDLRWNTHISNVCTKANRILGFLRRNLYSCPQEVKDAAYKGLVRPVLDYGSSIWDPTGVVLQEEFESVQKHAARFVTGNYNYETGIMTGILGQLKWNSLMKRRKDNGLILLYKGLKGKASVPTDDLIPKTRLVEISTLWHFRLPFLIQMFKKLASSPILSGIGMPSPILWSHPLKMQKIVLLSSLLWWELGSNSLITGPGEWLSFRHFTSKLSWSWSWSCYSLILNYTEVKKKCFTKKVAWLAVCTPYKCESAVYLGV